MKLRFFFDAGSGICIWAGDNAAREAFGYPIELENLPLDADTIVRGEDLIRRFDASLDWNDPAGPSPWPEEERNSFLRDANEFHSILVEKLGSSFEVLNEVRA